MKLDFSWDDGRTALDFSICYVYGRCNVHRKEAKFFSIPEATVSCNAFAPVFGYSDSNAPAPLFPVSLAVWAHDLTTNCPISFCSSLSDSFRTQSTLLSPLGPFFWADASSIRTKRFYKETSVVQVSFYSPYFILQTNLNHEFVFGLRVITGGHSGIPEARPRDSPLAS